jgi:hypothetical protein
MPKTKVQSSNKMLAYLVKNNLSERITEMIDFYEKEHNHKFTKDEWKELTCAGEEIINAHFPESSYSFTIKEKEREDFDKFVEEFVHAFLGALVCAMTSQMNLLFVMRRVEGFLSDQE